MKTKSNQIKWSALLVDAVNKNGFLLPAYSAFHPYSVGNQILAMSQCYERGLAISPINTYKGWKELGRQVQKGAKAIELCMPVTRKFKSKNNDGEEKEQSYRNFIYRKNWFLMSDTEGNEILPLKTPSFDVGKALIQLNITEESFEYPNGNCQGYARNTSIAVSPIASLPHKTRFHEMAHVVLGHTAEVTKVDSEKTPKDIKEVEAESVAYLLCSILDLNGVIFCRGYIQHWLTGEKIPEKSAQRIFSAADKILKAGTI